MLNPDVSLIGAEAFLNGVAKALPMWKSHRLPTFASNYGDARALLEVLPDNTFARIYLLYPDPWPKERQKRRRFVNAANLAHFHRLLSDGGLFLFASDIPDYVDWTREHVASHGGFREEGDSSQPFETGRAPAMRPRPSARAARPPI